MVLFIMSCQKDDIWSKSTSVSVIASSPETDDFDIEQGKFEVVGATIITDEISLSGPRLQAESYNESIFSSQNLDFFNPQPLSQKFNILQGNYEFLEMKFSSQEADNFHLELLYDHPGQGQGQPNIEEQEIDIYLDIREMEAIKVLNTTSSTSHLIKSENNYSLEIQLSAEELFKGVNLSALNGIINSNQNQSNNVEISSKFNVNLQDKILKNISEAITFSLKEL